jgi:hypothetical protein
LVSGISLIPLGFSLISPSLALFLTIVPCRLSRITGILLRVATCLVSALPWTVSSTLLLLILTLGRFVNDASLHGCMPLLQLFAQCDLGFL